MSVSKCWNCCSLVSGTTSGKVSQFLLGCSLSKPVRYWRKVSALGPWVKCTRNGARNSASSGKGVRGAWGNRSCFVLLMLIRVGYRRFTDSDKVVLKEYCPLRCLHLALSWRARQVCFASGQRPVVQGAPS